MPPRILHVVTNVAHYTDPSQPTGLWLSELSHAWDLFAGQGYVQTLASPQGGAAPLEPRSLKWPNLDGTASAGNLVLIGDEDVGIGGERVRGDGLTLVPHHHAGARRTYGTARGDGVAEKAAAAHGVEDLGNPGLHPRTRPSGENHDGGGRAGHG